MSRDDPPPWESSAARIAEATEQIPEVAHHRPTLRDHFASAALTGIIAANPRRVVDNQPANCTLTVAIAVFAYELADAMLKAREPKGDDK